MDSSSEKAFRAIAEHPEADALEADFDNEGGQP